MELQDRILKIEEVIHNHLLFEYPQIDPVTKANLSYELALIVGGI